MATYPIKMLLDENKEPFIPYLPSNAVVVNGSDKTVADQIADLHTEINERLTSVYTFKGSVTFENLPTTGQTTGDVYDITNDFVLNDVAYSAGTNLAWSTDHWDPLAGVVNVDTVYKRLDLSTTIMSTVSSINGYAFTIDTNKAKWLKLINDTVKASKEYVDFVTTKDDGYTFRLYILNTTDGTQNCSMMIYTPPYLLYNLHYADTYWYNKTVKVTFASGVATDITVQTGSGYSYREWLYPQFRNTTAFTPTAATHLATKGYVDSVAGGGGAIIKNVTTNNASNPFIFADNDPGVYYFNIGHGGTFYYKKNSSSQFAQSVTNIDILFLIVFKNVADVLVPEPGHYSEDFAMFYYIDYNNASVTADGSFRKESYRLNEYGDISRSNLTMGRLFTIHPQKIAGSKEFGTIPTVTNASLATANEHLTTKAYVDKVVAKVTSFPAASASELGNIYQYIGTAADISKTRGHFYECVSDGGSPATYSWSEISFSDSPVRQSIITTVNGFINTGTDPVYLYKTGNVYQLRGAIMCPNTTVLTGINVFKFAPAYAPLTNLSHGKILLTGTCLLEQLSGHKTLDYKMVAQYDSNDSQYYITFYVYSPISFEGTEYLYINASWIRYNDTP